MVNVIYLGSTGPAGHCLIRESLSRAAITTVVVYARSPEKLSHDLLAHPRIKVVKGELDNVESIASAFDIEGGIEAVISALGPPVFGIHPKGDPLAHGYENFIQEAMKKGCKRFISLGTISIPDEEDGVDLRYKALILGVRTGAPHAYSDILAIGRTFESHKDLDWTIIRVPLLTSSDDKSYIAGYAGKGPGVHLSRKAFAAFALDEFETPKWVRKRPIVSLGHGAQVLD
ncbi:NAD(P)-binding protein [Atractiella rhizophila]|nr:NAD(P)-binding protein [Atractiella rhizophila]